MVAMMKQYLRQTISPSQHHIIANAVRDYLAVMFRTKDQYGSYAALILENKIPSNYPKKFCIKFWKPSPMLTNAVETIELSTAARKSPINMLIGSSVLQKYSHVRGDFIAWHC